MSPAAYDSIGGGYAIHRRPDPRIAAQIETALGDAAPVLNLGAGAGSYEPDDRFCVAVEPAAAMLAQRLAGTAPAVRAVAEALPFPDGSFDGGMALLTVHHWSNAAAGLAELRRVVTGPVAVFTWIPEIHDHFWCIEEYLPATAGLDRLLLSPEAIADALGGGRIEVVPVPHDCTDGFYAAWWRRPEAYLDPGVRAAISGIARLRPDQVEPGMARLAADLADGTWHRRHADLLTRTEIDQGYRLVVSPGESGRPPGPERPASASGCGARGASRSRDESGKAGPERPASASGCGARGASRSRGESGKAGPASASGRGASGASRSRGEVPADETLMLRFRTAASVSGALHPVTRADAPSMVAVLADPALYVHTGGDPPSLERLTGWFAALESRTSTSGHQLWLMWVIDAPQGPSGPHRRADAEPAEHRGAEARAGYQGPAGYVQATVDVDRAALAWVVGTAFQGQGLATAAAAEVVACMAVTFGVSTFVASIAPGHVASMRVAERLGFQPTEEIDDGEVVWRLDL